MDKPMLASATVLGVILAEAGVVLTNLGHYLQGSTTLEEFLTKMLAAVGVVVAAMGARRAVGKIIANGKGR